MSGYKSQFARGDLVRRLGDRRPDEHARTAALQPDIVAQASSARAFRDGRMGRRRRLRVRFDEPLNADELTGLQAKGKVVMTRGLTSDELLGAEDWAANFAR